MSNFIKKHPVLYWIIVGSIATLVFTLVTLKGCAKLEKAHAASESMSLYDAYQIACEYVVEKYGENTLSSAPFRVITSSTSGTRYSVHFYSGKSGLMPDSSYVDYPFIFADMPMANIRVNFDGTVDDAAGWKVLVTGANDVLWSNYDIVDISTSQVVYFADSELNPDMTFSYLINAPYVTYDSYRNYNAFFDSVKAPIDISEFEVKFSVAGQPMRPEKGYMLDATLYVWLPTKEYMDAKYPFLMKNDFLQTALISPSIYQNDVKAWQSKVGTDGNSKLYKLKVQYEFGAPNTDSSGLVFRLNYDYKDLYDLLETAYGDGENDYSFKDYYVSNEWDDFYRDFVFAHMYISRMDNVLYTLIDDYDTYYGRVTTFTFVQNGSAVYSEVSKDFTSSENLESDIQSGVMESLKEGLIESGSKVDELQQQINNASGTLGSFDTEFEGVGLWEGISSVGNGLLGLTGFLGSVASVFGRVFSFLPYDAQQIMGYFFMISLFIALWKLIKG